MDPIAAMRWIDPNQPPRKPTREMLVRAGVKPRHMNVTLAEISDELPHKALLKEYLDNIVPNALKGRGLNLWGPFGSGKTASAVLAMRWVMAHHGRAWIVHAWDIPGIFIEDRPYDETMTMVDRLGTVDLLVIDDLTPRQGSPFNTEVIERVIRERYDLIRSTIITTNLNPDQFKQYVGESCYTITDEFLPRLKIAGKNWREGEGS